MKQTYVETGSEWYRYSGKVILCQYWANIGSVVSGLLLWFSGFRVLNILHRMTPTHPLLWRTQGEVQLCRRTYLPAVLHLSCTTDDGCGARYYSSGV